MKAFLEYHLILKDYTKKIFKIIFFYFINTFQYRLKDIPKRTHKKNSALVWARWKALKNFHLLSMRVIEDIIEAIEETYTHGDLQILSLLPLLADVRKKGQYLLKKRHFYHRLFLFHWENKLELDIKDLLYIENVVKSLPERWKLCKNTFELLEGQHNQTADNGLLTFNRHHSSNENCRAKKPYKPANCVQRNIRAYGKGAR